MSLCFFWTKENVICIVSVIAVAFTNVTCTRGVSLPEFITGSRKETENASFQTF